MARLVRCPCGGRPECRLCSGAGEYPYTPGEWGWQPFPCPTCGDRPPADRAGCPTCRGRGLIDPTKAPPRTGWAGVLYEPGIFRWVVWGFSPVILVAAAVLLIRALF